MPGRTQAPRASGKRISAAEFAIERGAWLRPSIWFSTSFSQSSCPLMPEGPSASAKWVIAVTVFTCGCIRTAL